MAYQELTQFNSPNYTPGRGGNSIQGETGHHWGDPRNNPQFEGVVAWLCKPRSQVSAHYVVTGTGRRVACLVDLGNTAWHAGNWTGNTTTIGIEMDPRCRDEDYDTAAELIADLWMWHGRKPLYPHRHWTSTQCPGNYDMARLEREAEAWYRRKTQPAAPAPAPQPQWSDMDMPRTLIAATDLRIINLDNNQPIGAPIPAGKHIEFRQKKQANGTTYLRSAYSTAKGLNYGIDIRSLKEIPAPEPPKPEWQRNLRDIEDTKLTVLAADGARILNLTNLQLVNDTIIPRGTQVDIAKETTVGGVRYYLSNYAVAKGLPWGIPADKLGVPAVEPEKEKPEWLKNLKDIEDKDMWARSEAPVLKIENGDVVKRLPINTKVRITHATQMVGRDLLVLDGGELAIETLYLNDKPVDNPRDDLEKRIGTLEKIVNKIVEFLTSLFKNFNK